MRDLSGWNKFIQNCCALKDPAELQQFFELTLTAAECQKIGSRYLILSELISSDKPQRTIAADLGVSLFNITRGVNQLKQSPPNVQQLILNAKDKSSL